MESEKKKFLCFAALLLLALFVFYFPFLCGLKSFYDADINAYFEPLCRFIGESLRHLRLPLWNRYLYGGMSEVAVPSPGVFYPPNWLYALLPFNQCFASLMVLHQFVAGVGGYLLVAGFGWGAFAAACAGGLLALSGYMFTLKHNYTLVAGACWLFLSLALLQRIRLSSLRPEAGATAAGTFLLASLSAFMFFASGRPEIIFPGALALAGFACVSFAYDFYGVGGRSRLNAQGYSGDLPLKALMLELFALASGLLLAMPAILPPLEWVFTSVRAGGLASGEMFAWSANWYDLLCLVVAQPLGDLTQGGLQFLKLVQTCPNAVPYLPSAYMGPVVLVMAFWAACDKKFRFRWPLLILFVFSVCLCLGRQTFVDPALAQVLPIISWFRYPVKLIVFPVLCLSILAARGAQVCLQGKLSYKTEIAAFALGAVWLLAAIYLCLGMGFPQGIWGQACVLIGRASLISAFLALLASAVARLYLLGKIKQSACAFALLFLLWAPLFAYAFSYAHDGAYGQFMETRAFLPDKISQIAGKDQGNCLSFYRLLQIYPQPFFSPPNYHRLHIDSYMLAVEHYARQVLFPNINCDYGFDSASGYEAAETEDQKKVYDNAITCAQFLPSALAQKSNLPLLRFCQVMGVRYVVTQMVQYQGPAKYGWPITKLDPKFFTLVCADKYMNVRIYVVKDFLPRVYLTDSWRIAGNHQYPLTQLMNPDATGFNPKAITIVEAKEDKYRQSCSEANSWGERFFCLKSDSGDRLVISTSAPKPGLLVLANQYYPGWKAFLDGRECEVYRANALVQSLFVPAGPHTIEMVFAPRSLKLGFALAACGLILAFMTFLALKRKKNEDG